MLSSINQKSIQKVFGSKSRSHSHFWWFFSITFLASLSFFEKNVFHKEPEKTTKNDDLHNTHKIFFSFSKQTKNAFFSFHSIHLIPVYKKTLLINLRYLSTCNANFNTFITITLGVKVIWMSAKIPDRIPLTLLTNGIFGRAEALLIPVTVMCQLSQSCWLVENKTDSFLTPCIVHKQA